MTTPTVVTPIGNQSNRVNDIVAYDVTFDTQGDTFISCTSTGDIVSDISFAVLGVNPPEITFRFAGTIRGSGALSSPNNMQATFITDGGSITDSWLWEIEIMTPTEAIYTVLSGFAGLQALIGNGDSPETYRIHAILMPQDSTVPAVTFQKVSAERQLTMTDAGGNGVERDRIRITSWAKTLASAQAVAEQVRLAMKAATTFEALQVFEADDHETETLLYSVVSDYSVWYKY